MGAKTNITVGKIKVLKNKFIPKAPRLKNPGAFFLLEKTDARKYLMVYTKPILILFILNGRMNNDTISHTQQSDGILNIMAIRPDEIIVGKINNHLKEVHNVTCF